VNEYGKWLLVMGAGLMLLLSITWVDGIQGGRLNDVRQDLSGRVEAVAKLPRGGDTVVYQPQIDVAIENGELRLFIDQTSGQIVDINGTVLALVSIDEWTRLDLYLLAAEVHLWQAEHALDRVQPRRYGE